MHDAHKRCTSNILLYTGDHPRSYTAFHNYMLCRIDCHTLLMNNFEHRLLRIDPILLYI